MNGGKSLLSQEVLSLSLSLTASIVAFREKFFLETRARSAACVTHPPDSRSSIRPPNISLSLSLEENRRRKSSSRKESFRGRKKLERGVEGGKSLRKVGRVELEWSESSENKRIFRSLLFFFSARLF